MKKLMAFGMITLLLLACSKGEEETGRSRTQAFPGSFTGTLTGKDFTREYKVAVRCFEFDTDDFGFDSDEVNTVDSNGDGIIVTGMALGGKFIFSIKDQGREFSTSRLANVSKRKDGMEGSGPLNETMGSTFDVRFSLACR